MELLALGMTLVGLFYVTIILVVSYINGLIDKEKIFKLKLISNRKNGDAKYSDISEVRKKVNK
ncbi:MAG TPA: hypothetical protein ACFCUD_09120 [Cyclobacteriaceae bacterium]